MHTFLKIIRAVGQFLATWVLWLVLSSGLTLLATTTHLTNRETVKGWPEEAGVYTNIIDVIPEVIAEEGGEDDGKSLQEMLDESGLDQDALLNSVKSVITPEYLQSQANIALDALYDALEGERDVFAFTLPISEKSEELAETLQAELVSQIKEYPTCSEADLIRAANGEDFNPFEAKCIPPGLDFEKEIEGVTLDFSDGEDSVVQDLEVTAADAEFVNSRLSVLQDSYSLAQSLPQILIGLTLLLGTLVVILAPSILKGIKKFGTILFVQGISTAVIYFILPRLSGVALGSIETEDETDKAVQEKLVDTIVEPLFNVVVDDIARTGLLVSLLAAVVGAIAWLSVYTWHKMHHHPQDAHVPIGHAGKKHRTKDDISSGGKPKEY